MKRVVVVMGVSGCGKSSVAQSLSLANTTTYIEADDLHPQHNIDKLRSGIPLEDQDRWPWLDAVAHAAAAQPSSLVIVACSALKKAYRDKLATIWSTHNIKCIFIHLNVPKDTLQQRLAQRTGHFMNPSLLESQLATLEPPQTEQEPNAYTVNVQQDTTNLSITQIITDIIKEAKF
jgi:gluconokinase